MKRRPFVVYGPACILAVALLLIWEIIVRVNLSLAQFLPAPSRIMQAISLNWDVLYTNTIPTLLETVLGMIVATALGLILAVLLDFTSWSRRAIYPLLIISQTIPIVALAPLLLIWGGIGIGPKVVVVTLYCFFPIAVATADGLASADPDLIKLLKSMRASHWQILWLVRLPGAMPNFFSGLRIAATYSVTGAIVAEFVGAYQGLGIFMETSINSHAIPVLFAAIVITAVLSLVLFGLVSVLEKLMLPWYHASRLPLHEALALGGRTGR